MEGKGWTTAKDLQIGDDLRNVEGETGDVEQVTTEQTTQEMYNLTVDEAHTFYIGDGQWLVHNACRILGGDLSDDLIGNDLVREAKAYLNSLDQNYRRTVIAVAQSGDVKIVTAWAGTNPRGLAQLENIATSRGVIFVPPSGVESVGHAEQVAYRWFSDTSELKIGISRAQGLCKDCYDFFRKVDFPNVFYP